MPSWRSLFGPKDGERGGEVGLAAAVVEPAPQIDRDLGEIGLLVGKVGLQRGDGLDHGGNAGAHLGGVVAGEVDLAPGLLQRPQRVGLVAQALPGHVARRRRLDRLGRGAKGRQSDPEEQVQPQAPMVELPERVVAEQVGIGGHHHPALAVTHGGQQPGAGGMGRVAGPQHDRAVALGQTARPRHGSRPHPPDAAGRPRWCRGRARRTPTSACRCGARGPRRCGCRWPGRSAPAARSGWRRTCLARFRPARRDRRRRRRTSRWRRSRRPTGSASRPLCAPSAPPKDGR